MTTEIVFTTERIVLPPHNPRILVEVITSLGVGRLYLTSAEADAFERIHMSHADLIAKLRLIAGGHASDPQHTAIAALVMAGEQL